MALGLGLLRLPPKCFWSMTLRELEAALDGAFGGAWRAAPTLDRNGLDELMRRYPDSLKGTTDDQ